MRHPAEQDLALYAGGDQGFLKSFVVGRHVRDCAECAEVVEDYRQLTIALAAEPDMPGWDSLAAEMKANIRLGLEAGACIGGAKDRGTVLPRFNPRLAVALASLMVLAGAGFFLREPISPSAGTVVAAQQYVQVDPEGVTITNVFGE